MSWLKRVFREFFGLFVEDGNFSTAILLWLGAAWFLLPRLGVPRRWSGPFLLAGLGLILIESVVRYCRERR